jgi:indolepyruvate ferredoxin oxidoreductase
VAVDSNKQAFLWGRRAAADLPAVEKIAEAAGAPRPPDIAHTLDEIVARRVAHLTAYQHAAYATRYADLVARVRAAEAERAPGHEELTEAVARNLFKLLAVKDEYEVARLYCSEDFRKALENKFAGAYSLRVHLAPPLLANRNLDTGHLEKKAFGPWVFGLFRILAQLKGLRGTVLDVFGYAAERRAERQLARDYEATVDELLQTLDAENHLLAVEIAAIPDAIRGFGHVKAKAMEEVKGREGELLAAYRTGQPLPEAAE